MRCFVLVVLSVCSLYAEQLPSGYNQHFCPPPTGNGGKDLPGLPENYMAEVDWVDHIEKRSHLLKQYSSVDLNIGATFITGLKAGVTSQYIILGNTGEQLTIFDVNSKEKGNCIVKKLSDMDEFALPSSKDRLGDHHIQGFKSNLEMGGTPVGSLMYNGTENKNGVTCDVWYGCLFISAGSLTISVKYYFAEKAWSTASGASVKPIAVYAKGMSEQDELFRIEQTFNYNYFSEVLPPHFEGFQIPEHVYCQGRKSTRQIPKVPSHFSFTAEIFNHVSNTVSYTQEYFNTISNYSAFEFAVGNGTISVINDFTTGLSYKIKDSSKCDETPAITTLFDSKVYSNGKTRMRTLEEFFYMDNQESYPYQFVGQYQVRELQADSWISYRPITFHLGQKSKSDAKVEWYFTSETSGKSAKPLKVIIDMIGVNVTYNIFNFNGSPDEKFTNIVACLSQYGSRTFKMKLTANGPLTDDSSDIKDLKSSVTNSILASTGIRPLRLQDIQVNFLHDNAVSVTFTIYGASKGVSLQLASQRFVKSFTRGTFKVHFLTKKSVGLILLPFQDSLREIEKTEWPVYAVSNEAVG